MKVKLKIKKGDIVKVIAGDAKYSDNNTGKVLAIDVKKQTAIVEGVNLISKHTKPNASNPQGGIISKEAPVHISNLMLVMGGTPTKVGRKIDEKTKKVVRYAKKTGEVIK